MNGVQPTGKSLADLETEFRVTYAEVTRLGRMTVELAWTAGRAKTDIKSRLGHGQWLDWLETEGLSRRTASKYLSLAKIQMGTNGPFETIDSALKSLPQKVPKKRDPEPEEPSSEEVLEIEVETDRVRAERAESETALMREELEKTKEQLADAGPVDRAASQDKQNEIELSLMREKKKSAETYDLLETARRETRKLKRRLAAIKRALLADKSHAHILATKFGIQKA